MNRITRKLIPFDPLSLFTHFAAVRMPRFRNALPRRKTPAENQKTKLVTMATGIAGPYIWTPTVETVQDFKFSCDISGCHTRRTRGTRRSATMTEADANAVRRALCTTFRTPFAPVTTPSRVTEDDRKEVPPDDDD
ncbi:MULTISPECIES: hypothetical protein [unclassified Streptomyces]|uniref:hypothetical protein n=1 Tax=unclassified Streptomyces TaxID=2593676 RepID=UPI001180F736|nr:MULTISPECIES: hypothetical protein [unclassified Streptomyces]TRO61593.1 hypothetical protein E4K73_25025 [Streptomyces sp. IB201691-2A2]